MKLVIGTLGGAVWGSFAIVLGERLREFAAAHPQEWHTVMLATGMAVGGWIGARWVTTP